MQKSSASPSPCPSSAGSTNSGKNSRGKGTGLDRGVRPHAGPRPNQDVCISEEVKIGINLAIERFRMNESQKELEFPTSLTATERAYIHRMAEDLGMKHRSKGKMATRYLILTKKDASTWTTKSATFQLVRNSRYQISNLLHRFPLTSKERLELQLNTDKSLVNEVSKELARTATGRLNNGVPQVPPKKGNSELTSFAKSLPIHVYRAKILQVINNNQICVISGDTGSGKTTQVPQMILDDGCEKSQPCRIFCTQPRRLAALSISERVASERGEKVGQTVGFQIRLESRVSPKTLLTFCTNGVLLRTLMGNETALNTVTHVIVDEVHERDKFCDFLLISLRDIAWKNPNIKIILMSATLNIDLFVQYFNNCPVVAVPGNLFPVEEYFLEHVLKWTKYSTKKMDKYRLELEKLVNKTEQLSEWCSQKTPSKMEPKKKCKEFQSGLYAGEESDDDSEKEVDDRAVLTQQLAVLGVGTEKEDLEPWVIQEMDQFLSDIWLTGNEDLFPQIFHLITSENVSVDYQHSQTSVTPLMIAAGRGFLKVVEQLLTMEADASLKAANGWTALDWAKKFERQDIVALLEAHMLASANCQHGNDTFQEDANLEEEDKNLLNVYQHCWDDDKVDIDLVTTLLLTIMTTEPEGAILVFLPGYDEIVAVRNRIDEDDKFFSLRYSVFLLHSSMQSSDQKKVFRPSPPGIRKIILATNIAETSITINDVVYVIDSGKVKEKTFDALLQITMLKSNWISKASAIQRKGRAGRVRPGVCYHLFSKVRHQHMCEYATPELLRCPLQDLCLQTKLLAPLSESVADFLAKSPEAPPYLVIRSAVSILKQMDAFDEREELTELGRHLADLPVEPGIGKMVLNSIVLKCLDPVLTIVCSLTCKDPFQLPGQPSERRQVHLIRQEFSASTCSDHMTLLRVFQAWQKARTDGWEKAFCAKNYVSPAVMEMIVGLRAQLLGQLRASGFVRARGGGDIRDLNTNSENWAVVKAALCAGAYPNIIHWDRQSRRFVGQASEKINIHISSVLPRKSALPSDWLFYEEMTRAGNQASFTGMACVKCCTILSPVTVAIFAGPSKLPADALREASEEYGMSVVHGETSDSENEDPEDNKNSTLQINGWLSFRMDAESASLVLQLRQKWHCLFLRRIQAPSKPWSPVDEAVINAVVNVLTNEEQALGLQQPAGIGQRPRPMSAECIMSSGHGGGRGLAVHEEGMGNSRHRFSTSAKKATSTPPKRKDFLSPNIVKSEDDSYNTSPLSSETHYGSGTSTPLHSPQTQPGSEGQCRYFIMKCSSQKNIDMSVSKGAWATSKTNEKKLNKAFMDGQTVFLIFSIQGSSHFQGYGKMSSIIGTDKSSDFNGQGGVFSVDWVKRGNIQFQATHHLLNPWNDHKRVQISRDGQELEPSVGDALLRLWESFSQNNWDISQSEDPRARLVGSYNDRYNASSGGAYGGKGGVRFDTQGNFDSGELYTDIVEYDKDSEFSGQQQVTYSEGYHQGYTPNTWTGYQHGQNYSYRQQPTQQNFRGQGYINQSGNNFVYQQKYHSQEAGYQQSYHPQESGYQQTGYGYAGHSNQYTESPVMLAQRDGYNGPTVYRQAQNKK